MFKKFKEKLKNRSFIEEIPSFEEDKMDKKKYKEFMTFINKYKILVKKIDCENEKLSLKEKKNLNCIISLEEKIQNLSNENIELNQLLIGAEYFQDFNIIFEKSLKIIFKELDIDLIKKISHKNNEIDNGLTKLIYNFSEKNINKDLVEIKREKILVNNLNNNFKDNLRIKNQGEENNLKNNEINDDKKLNKKTNVKNRNEIFDNFKRDIKALKMDIEIIESNYDILLKQLKDLYYKFSKKNNKKIVEKYGLNGIFLISENKFKNFSNELSKLKSKNSQTNNENKRLNKNLKMMEKKNLELKKDFEKIFQKNFKKEKEYDIIFQKKEEQAKEIKGYLEILGTLQNENKILNEKTKENLDNKELIDEKINNLEKENNKKIIELRKLELKNKTNIKEHNYFEEKTKDLENILKNENLKNKDLFLENQNLKQILTLNKKKIEDLKKQILEKKDPKKETIKTSTNDSSLDKIEKSPFFIDIKNDKKIFEENNKIKITEKEIELLDEIENLKMLICSNTNQLTIERKIFDDFRSETNLELEKNQDFIYHQKKKIDYLLNFCKSAKIEVNRLNEIINDKKLDLEKKKVKSFFDEKILTNLKIENKTEILNFEGPLFLRSDKLKNYDRFLRLNKKLKKIYRNFVLDISNNDLINPFKLVKFEKQFNDVLSIFEHYLN